MDRLYLVVPCYNEQEVLPETVRIIEDSAFLESRGLKSFICYGPVERLGIRAFENKKAA